MEFRLLYLKIFSGEKILGHALNDGRVRTTCGNNMFQIFLYFLSRCPCSNHRSYGMAFLFVPAIFLLGLSLLFFQKSWNVLRIFWKQNNYKTRCNYFLSSLIEFFRPFLASASWIIVALLRGECYVCIRVGPGKQCETYEQKVSKIFLFIPILTIQLFSFTYLLATIRIIKPQNSLDNKRHSKLSSIFFLFLDAFSRF